jgi:hypothetical protein
LLLARQRRPLFVPLSFFVSLRPCFSAVAASSRIFLVISFASLFASLCCRTDAVEAALRRCASRVADRDCGALSCWYPACTLRLLTPRAADPRAVVSCCAVMKDLNDGKMSDRQRKIMDSIAKRQQKVRSPHHFVSIASPC